MIDSKESKNLFIYHLKLTPDYNDSSAWNDNTFQVIQDHLEFLKTLGEDGIVLFAGRTDLNPGDKNLFGIAIIRATNLDHAVKIMSHDPAVVHGIQQSDVFPFRMALHYPENLNITL